MFKEEESLKKRTLCIGSSYTRNYGDRAIFQVLNKALKSQGNIYARPFPLKPILANRRGASMNLFYKALAGLFILPRHYYLMSKRIQTVSTVIVGGGNLIHDVYPLTVVQFLFTAITIRFSGRRFLIFGIGAGPLRYWFSRLCIGIACGLSNGVVVRDTYSRQTLQHCPGYSKWLRPKIVPDLVLSLNKKAESRDHFKQKLKIGISVMFYMMPKKYPGGTKELHQSYLTRMEDLIRLVVKELDCEILLFSNEPSEDQATVNELYEKVKDLENISKIKVDCLSTAIKLPATCDYHIGTRLHSLIFSLSQDVPSVALASHGRITGLFTDLEAQDLLHDISNFKPQDVIMSIKAFQKGRSVSLLKMVETKRGEVRKGLSDMVIEINKMGLAFFEGENRENRN